MFSSRIDYFCVFLSSENKPVAQQGKNSRQSFRPGHDMAKSRPTGRKRGEKRAECMKKPRRKSGGRDGERELQRKRES